MEKQNNTPRLRFPEFTGDWVEKTLGDSFDERNDRNRGDLPLLSLGEEGLSYQSETTRKDNSNADKSKYLRVAVGDIAYNTMRMWQGRCVYVDKEGIVSPAYTVCQPKPGIDSRFHFYLFKTDRMIQLFRQNSQGLVSDTLNLKFEPFSKIKYLLPPTLAEQEKIASVLMEADAMIAAQGQKVDALKDKKKGLMLQLFPQDGETTPRFRFPGFTGEWMEMKLGEVLDYEQPTKYLVDGDNYKTSGTPVLTAGKSFILGYTDETEGIYTDLPVIIFDDFVTESKYVTFPFKVKSSAIKMLKLLDPQKNNLRVVYEVMKMLKYPVKEHKRYWISEYSKQTILLPPTSKEQQKIATCLSEFDSIIASESAKLEALKDHKKGLMQQLFPQPAK